MCMQDLLKQKKIQNSELFGAFLIGSADPSLFSPESVGGKYTYMCVYPSFCLSVCLSVSVYLCVNFCVCMYIYVYSYICVYTVDRYYNSLILLCGTCNTLLRYYIL